MEKQKLPAKERRNEVCREITKRAAPAAKCRRKYLGRRECSCFRGKSRGRAVSNNAESRRRSVQTTRPDVGNVLLLSKQDFLITMPDFNMNWHEFVPDWRGFLPNWRGFLPDWRGFSPNWRGFCLTGMGFCLTGVGFHLTGTGFRLTGAIVIKSLKK